MSQFVSKWLCNSRVLSSRDKGHPIILGKGIRISGKQAPPGWPAAASPALGSAFHKYTERWVSGRHRFPLAIIDCVLRRVETSDQN